ncbi:MAG: HAMP domain-containing sensor histidine kinase [Arcobacter sp.]|uniref:sensor histidine kinase n=1 Tax=Arcobacter sp. TaxID=1872629 RepID=UPI003C770CBE
MSFKEHILYLEIKKIKIFRYVLANEEILNILDKYEVSVDDFIKKLLTKTLENIILNLKDEKNTLSFLSNFKFDKNDYFLILRSFKNSIYLHMKNEKLDDFIFRKTIDEIFDYFYVYLLNEDNTNEKVEVKIEDTKRVNYLLTLLDENLPLIDISFDGKVIKSSKSFDELFLYKDKKSSELNILDLIMYKKNAQIFLKEILENKTFSDEIEVQKYDKTVFWTNIKSEKKEDTITLIFKDITYKKNLEKQKKAFLEQSKTAAMGELISMIAHQWRQPLQTVSILAQKLIITKATDGHVNNEILEKAVKDIDIQLSYMSRTIDDFRNFFKPESSSVLSKPSEIIEKAIKFLHYVLTINNIDFELDIKKDYEINIIENNLIQVLINIIKNSIDVLLERNIQSKKIIIRCDFNENYVIIEIEDNAGGIPKEDLKKVFDSYYTTKNEEKGTGLGLYMSKIIIEDHSLGKLSVQNGSDGALFKIELPKE